MEKVQLPSVELQIRRFNQYANKIMVFIPEIYILLDSYFEFLGSLAATLRQYYIIAIYIPGLNSTENLAELTPLSLAIIIVELFYHYLVKKWNIIACGYSCNALLAAAEYELFHEYPRIVFISPNYNNLYIFSIPIIKDVGSALSDVKEYLYKLLAERGIGSEESAIYLKSAKIAFLKTARQINYFIGDSNKQYEQYVREISRILILKKDEIFTGVDAFLGDIRTQYEIIREVKGIFY